MDSSNNIQPEQLIKPAIKHAIKELSNSKDGRKALEIFYLASYFAHDDIHAGTFLPLVTGSSELNIIFQLLDDQSLVIYDLGENIFVTFKTVQNYVRNYLKQQKKEKNVIKQALRLLCENLASVSNLYHAMSVFTFAKSYTSLIKESSRLVNLIVFGLAKQRKCKDAVLFAHDSYDFLKRTIGDHHPATVTLQYNLGTLLKFGGSEEDLSHLPSPLHVKDCKIFRQKVCTSLLVVARQANKSGQYAEALLYYERALGNTSVLKIDSEILFTAWRDYARLLCNMDYTRLAETLLQKLLQKGNQILNPDDNELSVIKSDIAHVLLKQCKYSTAFEYFQDVYEKRKMRLEETHRDVLSAQRGMALCLQHQGKYDTAVEMYGDVAGKFETVLGEVDLNTLETSSNLASVLLFKGESEKSYQMCQDIYQKLGIAFGEKSLESLRIKHNIGSIYIQLGKNDEAVQVFQEVFEGYNSILGAEHKETKELKIVIESIKCLPVHLEFSDAAVKSSLHTLAGSDNLYEMSCLIRNGADVNSRDGDGNTPLHKAAENGQLEIAELLLENGAFYNPRNNENITPLGLSKSLELKTMFVSIEKLFADVKVGDYLGVFEYISSEKAILNVRDCDGRTALHWAANENQKYIMHLLLDSEADATIVTTKNNSPLHIAIARNYNGIAELLLQFIKSGDLNKFVNAQNSFNNNTALHLAALTGATKISKILLKSGAVFDAQNGVGFTPAQLATDCNIKNLLKLINVLFDDAVNGNPEITSKLQNIDPDELKLIMSARNNQGHTIVQAAMANKHLTIARKLLELLKVIIQTESVTDFSKLSSKQRKSLTNIANIHLNCSETYITLMEAQTSPLSDKNYCPWKTLKEGSYYLRNAYRFFKGCDTELCNKIIDKNLLTLKYTLEMLEFHPSHVSAGYTPEAYGGQVECFVSKGEGTNYYNILHSDLKKNILMFLKLAKKNIDEPVERIVESLLKLIE